MDKDTIFNEAAKLIDLAKYYRVISTISLSEKKMVWNKNIISLY